MTHLKQTAYIILLLILVNACKKEVAPVSNSVNKPPVANPGNPQTIVLPRNSVTLSGIGIDTDGTIVSYQWSYAAGPSSFTILNPTNAFTRVENLIEGIYHFDLSVTDNGGASAKASVVITVHPANWTSNDPHLITVGFLSDYRGHVAIGAIENKIFFAGGYLNGGLSPNKIPLSSRVDIFDVTSNSWATAELSEPRSSIGMIAVGTKILFAGGIKEWDGGYWGDVTASTRIDIYDITSNSWSTAELPEALSFQNGWVGATAAAGTKAFFVGSSDGITSNVYIYDVITKSWSTKELSVGRMNVTTASLPNKIMITGGKSKNVDVYDLPTNAWTVELLSEQRTEGLLRGAAVGNKALFAGGGFFPNYTSKVDIYDNASQRWSVAALSRPMALSAAATAGDYVLFFGDNRVDVFHSITNSWSYFDVSERFSDGAVFIGAGGNVYATKGMQVWRVQL